MACVNSPFILWLVVFRVVDTPELVELFISVGYELCLIMAIEHQAALNTLV